MYRPYNATIYPVSQSGIFGEFIIASERLYLLVGSNTYCYTKYAYEKDIPLRAPKEADFIHHILSLSCEQYLTCLTGFIRRKDIEQEMKNLRAAVLRARRKGASQIVCRKAYDWLVTSAYYGQSVESFARRYRFLSKAELDQCRAYAPDKTEIAIRTLFSAFQKQLRNAAKSAS